jgi:lysophospholipase L1-like esterase
MSSSMSRVLRRSALALLGVLLALGGVIAIEILIALRRDYLPTTPVMRIGGTFGRRGDPALSLVVLGDSTAAGVGAGSPQHAYPTLLARRLAGRGYRVTLRAFGAAGARVADLSNDQVERGVALSPDVVFVGIGANDVTHVTPLDDVRRAMGEVVARLSSSGAAVVVAGAPDMRARAFLEPLRTLAGWRGRAVAGAIEDAATARGARAVPLARRTARAFEGDPAEHYSSDDFHPGPRGYARWADAIFPELDEAASEVAPR